MPLVAALAALAVTAPAPAIPPAAVPAPPPVVPVLPGVTTAPPLPRIPGAVGRQGTARFVINASVPPGVDAARFTYVVQRSARRWGLRSSGRTTANPLVPDRRNVVGFSDHLPGTALGLQRDVFETVRRRSTAQVVSRRIVDQDLAVRASLRWQQGPDRPAADEFDLETVILHELGHMAGNKHHVVGCENTPMVESAQLGEWWRSTTDWFRPRCQHPEAGLRLRGNDRAIAHEVVTVVRYVGG